MTNDEIKIIYIKWHDASHLSGWHNSAEIGDFANEDTVVETCGYLVSENDDAVIIASSVSRYRAGDLTRIPRNGIKEFITFGEKDDGDKTD